MIKNQERKKLNIQTITSNKSGITEIQTNLVSLAITIVWILAICVILQHNTSVISFEKDNLCF